MVDVQEDISAMMLRKISAVAQKAKIGVPIKRTKFDQKPATTVESVERLQEVRSSAMRNNHERVSMLTLKRL